MEDTLLFMYIQQYVVTHSYTYHKYKIIHFNKYLKKLYHNTLT